MKKQIFYLLVLLLTLPLWAGVSVATSPSGDVHYDGLWFLGCNLHKDIFSGEDGLRVRHAVQRALRLDRIVALAGETEVPAGIVPPGMEGHRDGAAPVQDLAGAKKTMKAAGFSLSDSRLKTLTLLHTNGIKTKLMAHEIQKNLSAIGIKITLDEVDYANQDRWTEALASGRYHFFLMGYKADDPEDGLSFLRPLFHSRGEANFTFYHDTVTDRLMDTMQHAADPVVRKEKIDMLVRRIDEMFPVVGLFYIQRL